MYERATHPTFGSLERPDTFFALVAGLYVALLTAPAVLVALAVWVTDGAGGLYITLLVWLAAGTTVVTWRLTHLRGLPERLGASRLVWGLPVVPVVVTGGYLAVAHTLVPDAATSAALLSAMVSMGSLPAGMALITMARNRYTAAVVDAVECEWKAGWPERSRERLNYAAIGGMVVVLLAWLGGLVLGIEWLQLGGQIVLFALIPVMGVGQPHTYRVTPAGLERRNPAKRYIYAWDRFESYERTDDLLVIRWRAWWRPAIRCSLAEIDDVDAVEETLAQYLPRSV